jgi:hypothetical protein
VVRWKVPVAEGYGIPNNIILCGVVVVLRQVYTLASTREGADVRLNDERGAVVELGRMGELKSGQTWAGWKMDSG